MTLGGFFAHPPPKNHSETLVLFLWPTAGVILIRNLPAVAQNIGVFENSPFRVFTEMLSCNSSKTILIED